MIIILRKRQVATFEVGKNMALRPKWAGAIGALLRQCIGLSLLEDTNVTGAFMETESFIAAAGPLGPKLQEVYT